MDKYYGYGDIGSYEDEYINIEGNEIYLGDFDIDNLLKVMKQTKKNIEKYIKTVESELKIILSKKDQTNKICKKLLEEYDILIDNRLKIIDGKSSQFKSMFLGIIINCYNIIDAINSEEQSIIIDNIEHNDKELESLSSRISNLERLSIITETIDKGVIIFGKNGSGKSSFVSFLKKYYSRDMIIIPAQKVLICGYNDREFEITKQDFNEEQNRNIVDELHNNEYSNVELVASNFKRLNSVIINETLRERSYVLKLIKDAKNNGKNLNDIDIPDNFLEKINSIIKKVLPNIQIEINIDEHMLQVNNRGNLYSINSMSDGEKSILFYIGNVLLAKNNHYIIIDEPETFLNAALYNSLWNILENERKDCQFIYITHNIDFIKSRSNKQLIWIKKYIHPDEWDFEKIDDSFNLPSSLLLEVYGSEKILFCEGNKNSYDYKIYNSLFGSTYTVVPVGTCYNVEQYTKSINGSKSLHGTSAIGIIDGDNRSEDEITKLQKNKIYISSFNEIEMLLCDDIVLKKIMEHLSNEEKKIKIDKFKKEFIDKINCRKDKIATDIVIKKINNILSSHMIETIPINEIENYLINFIKSIKIEDEYNKAISLIDETVSNKKYEDLLKICNLKKEIIPGLTNKISNEYAERAIFIVQTNFNEEIKSKYFPDIE